MFNVVLTWFRVIPRISFFYGVIWRILSSAVYFPKRDGNGTACAMSCQMTMVKNQIFQAKKGRNFKFWATEVLYTVRSKSDGTVAIF